MSVLKLLKKNLVDSQIYVSFMGSCLAAFFMLEQNTFRWSTLTLIALTFFNGYLYTKYQNVKHKRVPILIFNIITSVFCFVLILKDHNYITFIHWGAIIILGLLYNSFFLEHYVRKLPLVKIFYVGIVWGLVMSFLALDHINLPIFFTTVFYISALVLPFDIRDLENDRIITFPKLIGIPKTKQLAYVLLIISNSIAISFSNPEFYLSLISASLISAVLIHYSSTDRKDAYFSFWVETCCGLPLLFYYFIHSVTSVF